MMLGAFVLIIVCIEIISARDDFNVKEEGPLGENIGSVIQFFKNSGITTENKGFQLFRSDPKADVFEVNQTTGALFVKKRIDREELCPISLGQCIIEFYVIAGMSSSVTMDDRVDVRVTVKDINDSPPYWPNGPELVLNFIEGGPGAKISIPAAEDQDSEENAKLEYHLETDGAPFKLIREDNKLTLDSTAQLDREQKSNYSMILKAVDGGKPALTGTVVLKVNIMDINDNVPRFLLNDYSMPQPVREDTPIGKVILKLEATDADAGVNGLLRFSFSKLNTANQKMAQKYLKIHLNGDIEIIKKLDYDRMEQKSFAFEAQVEDSAPYPYGHSASASVIINISDVNDESPQMQICFFPNGCGIGQHPSMSESVQPGSNVAEVRVTDLDHDGKDKIECVLQKVDNTNSEAVKFTLSHRFTSDTPKIFDLKTQGHFDREQRSIERIIIKCNDEAGHISARNVDIRILDSNDNSPVFQSVNPVLYIDENQRELPTLIHPAVHASDMDEDVNREIEYSIPSAYQDLIEINPKSGFVSAKMVFDREQKSTYLLHVIASDRGTPARSTTATFTLSIRDKNDCAPIFYQSQSEMTVQENKPPNTQVGKVEAKDADAKGVNSQIVYRLLKSDEGEGRDTAYFSIHPETGVIRTQRSLDRETKSIYHLNIEARDHGSPSLSSTTRVTVVVEDVNDNPPVFKKPTKDNNEFILQGLEPGQQITMVEAEDIDKENTQITYSIVKDKSSDDLFALDSSGMLYLNKGLHGVPSTEWNLELKACDSGNKCTSPFLVKIRRLVSDKAVEEESSRPSIHKRSGSTSNKPSDNEAIVIFLGIIFGILLITLVVIIFVLRRKAVTIRGQRKQQDGKMTCEDAKAAVAATDLELPSNEMTKEWPPIYEDQRRPEGEYLLSQAATAVANSSNVDTMNSKRKWHLYTTSTPNQNRSRKGMISTELPERSRSICSMDYQTLDTLNGTIYHHRTGTAAFSKHQNPKFHSRYNNAQISGLVTDGNTIYPSSLHTYYEIKGDATTPKQHMKIGKTTDHRMVSNGTSFEGNTSNNYDNSTLGNDVIDLVSKKTSTCTVDRSVCLSQTQYPFSPYAEASFV